MTLTLDAFEGDLDDAGVRGQLASALAAALGASDGFDAAVGPDDVLPLHKLANMLKDLICPLTAGTGAESDIHDQKHYAS